MGRFGLLPVGSAPLTSFSDAKDLTEGEGELDAAPGKRTLVFVFSAAVFQDELGKQLDRETLVTLLFLPSWTREVETHPAVGVRMTSGKKIHGVQSQEARRGSHQVLSRVAVVLKGHQHSC